MAYSTVYDRNANTGTNRLEKYMARDRGRQEYPFLWQCRLASLLHNCDFMLQFQTNVAFEHRTSVCIFLMFSAPMLASLCSHAI